MGSQKPVIVYAASGYTGRLTCEALARLKVPFVAAGRNKARLEEVAQEMRAKGADCVAQAAEHTPRGLRELFRGSKVVVNISGPFSLLGHAVVDAALVEGCHYVDSTGEQDFMLDVRKEYGPAFEKARLLLAPSVAYLWGVGCIAADLCLETPGIDSLEVAYAPPTLQTMASLQSVMRAARREGYSIVDGHARLLPPAEVRHASVPGRGRVAGVRIGAGETTFFEGDGRIRNCETLFCNPTLVRATPMLKAWHGLGATGLISGDALDRWSDELVARFKKNPPPEDPETHRYVVVASGKGPSAAVRVVVNGTSAYALTGFLCGVAAQAALEGKIVRHGYASVSQAFGARYAAKRLEEFGTTMTVEADGAPRGASAPRTNQVAARA